MKGETAVGEALTEEPFEMEKVVREE